MKTTQTSKPLSRKGNVLVRVMSRGLAKMDQIAVKMCDNFVE